MSREWAPGDVAIVDRGDGVRVRAMRLHSGTWSWPFGVTHSAADARPLVVIDPENREQVVQWTTAVDAEFARRGWANDGTPEADVVDAMQAALRDFAAPKPPKPEEPTGLGAVVEGVS